jgi:hypothetical protein
MSPVVWVVEMYDFLSSIKTQITVGYEEAHHDDEETDEVMNQQKT